MSIEPPPVRHEWAVKLDLHDGTHTYDHQRHPTFDQARERRNCLRHELHREQPGPGDVVAFHIVCLTVEEKP